MVTGALLLAIVAAGATPTPAPAPPEELSLEAEADRITRVTALNRQALDEIKRGALAAARKHLVEADRLAAPLRSHPIVARTALNLGAVEALTGGPQKRVDELVAKAVQVQPDIQMTRQLTTRAEVMAAYALALEKARCERVHPSVWTCPWTDDNPDLAPPKRVAAFECPARDEVPAARPVVIRCAANPALPIERATLFYAAPAAPKFTALKMRRNERGWWTATIPGDRVGAKSMRFYAEALDAQGHRVASAGTDASPGIFLVHTPDSCFCKGPDLEQPTAARR
jgi:hypothetical protein